MIVERLVKKNEKYARIKNWSSSGQQRLFSGEFVCEQKRGADGGLYEEV